MLDSSTAALPLIRKTLKRSASTASLPTPPRTHRKHARGRSRGSCDSDSDDFGLLSDKEELTGQNKKRRTEETGIVEADEEAFWLSRPSEAASSTKIDSCLISKSQSAPLLYRKRESQNSRINVAPVSPPPSHRKSTTIVASAKNSSMSVNASPVTSPPSTPRTRSSTKRVTCDLAENPFLATPVGNSDTPELTASSADPSPRTPSYDKPYITYVFRGTRRTYQNPHYNHAEGRPLSPSPASKLPIEHPDYSPSMQCPPKLLFPEAHRKPTKNINSTPKTRSKARRLSLSSSNEEDEVTVEIRPKKLNFLETAKKPSNKEMTAFDPFSA